MLISGRAARVVEGRISPSGRNPRSRYHFGFPGKRPGRGHKLPTTDEILDSLTRHAKLMEKDEDERTSGLQTILEAEPADEPPQFSNLKSRQASHRFKTRTLEKSAFTLMLIGGIAFLWIYSKLSQTLNPTNLTLLHQTMWDVGFGDFQKILLIALCAFIFCPRRSSFKK